MCLCYAIRKCGRKYVIGILLLTCQQPVANLTPLLEYHPICTSVCLSATACACTCLGQPFADSLLRQQDKKLKNIQCKMSK